MKFMELERQALEDFMPGLDEKLAKVPLDVLENRESPGMGLFRDSAGPGLLVPKEYGGGEATPLEAMRVQRAIGARSPSLAVATTMHHFSMASIVSLGEASTGFEWLVLEAVARDHRLIASGFAEGRPGQNILSPSLAAVPVENGYLISGSKRPCSLALSMDLLTASIAVQGEDGEPVMGVALIPAESPGIRITPFWNANVLAGAESEAINLEDVFVHQDLIINTTVGFGHELDQLTLFSFLWFELLITASYLGAVSALAERVFESSRVSDSEKARLLVEVEGAALLLEGMARAQETCKRDNDDFARSLIGRYAIQDALYRAVSTCTELLGGMAFIGGPEVAYLVAATHGLGLHPPNRHSAVPGFAEYLRGGKLQVS